MKLSLKKICEKKHPTLEDEKLIKELQLDMLRIQQGVWHRKDRVIIMFEGFDASGKGGAIRNLTEVLDPRSVKVHPIAAPTPEEKGKHWLYRFWVNIPAPGHIAIFDRSWYGRVLVERVDELISKNLWQSAYEEINEFERTLQNDGVVIIKIFLGISKEEQLKRFHDRLNDPYKQWKLTMDDVKARSKWNQYVKAVDEMFKKTSPSTSPWHLIAGNNKPYARWKTLETVTKKLGFWKKWMDKKVTTYDTKELAKLLKKC